MLGQVREGGAELGALEQVDVVEHQHERFAVLEGVAQAGEQRLEARLRGPERIEDAAAQRLDLVERGGDLADQRGGIVVVALDGHPGDRALVGVCPFGEHRGLAVARGRLDHRHPGVRIAAELLLQAGARNQASPLRPRRRQHPALGFRSRAQHVQGPPSGCDRPQPSTGQRSQITRSGGCAPTPSPPRIAARMSAQGRDRFAGRRAVLRVIAVWIVTAATLVVLASIMERFTVDGDGAALVAAAAIGLVNALVWPLVIRIALPFTVLTLGLGVLLLNGGRDPARRPARPGMHVDGLGAGIVVAIGITIVNTLATSLLAIDDDDFYYRNVHPARGPAPRRHERRLRRPGRLLPGDRRPRARRRPARDPRRPRCRRSRAGCATARTG